MHVLSFLKLSAQRNHSIAFDDVVFIVTVLETCIQAAKVQ